jgi:hypothetical protein
MLSMEVYCTTRATSLSGGKSGSQSTPPLVLFQRPFAP